MSSKYALIFVLGAVFCLVATEAAAQRRSGVARASNSESEAIKAAGELEEQQELDGEKRKLEEELNAAQQEVKQSNNAAEHSQKQQNKTAVRSSDDDVRARRTVRRRGPRRNGNRAGRRRRGGRGRRGNRNRIRSGPRRNIVRKRVGRPVRTIRL